jgi:DmsE family decaheme c-type cytochrome
MRGTWLALLAVAVALACQLPDLEPRQAATAPGPPPNPAAFAGPDACAACHPDWSESYGKSSHARALDDATRPPDQRACEACHGAGQAHVDGGGGTAGNLQTFAASEPGPQRAAPCLRCHGNDPALHGFSNGEHALADVTCTDCHDPHGGKGRFMLRAGGPLWQPLRGATWRDEETAVVLCYRCHPDVRSTFALPERHKVPEGVVSCMDCHQPHGTPDRAMLRDGEQRTCFRCHGEVEGPFVFEHFGLTLEGCQSCHEPHGSANRHLLRYQQVAQLCYQCHAATPASHVQPSYRDCTRCHTAIHGSNSNSFFLEP